MSKYPATVLTYAIAGAFISYVVIQANGGKPAITATGLVAAAMVGVAAGLWRKQLVLGPVTVCLCYISAQLAVSYFL